MGDELLSDIIHLENDIQEQLEDERARATAWLEKVRDEEEMRATRGRREQEQESTAALAEAREKSAQQAATIRADADRYCQSLESIEENELIDLLEGCLEKILPR